MKSSLSSLFSQDIMDWLKTGFYKGLTVGMTRAECLEKTGLSESELASTVWPVELKFEEEPALSKESSRIQQIYTEEFGECADLDVAVNDMRAHSKTVKLEKIICLLGQTNIEFDISKTSFKKTGSYCIRIEAQHGINLIFHISAEKEHCLLETMQQYVEGYATYFYTEE